MKRFFAWGMGAGLVLSLFINPMGCLIAFIALLFFLAICAALIAEAPVGFLGLVIFAIFVFTVGFLRAYYSK